jgi:hypothetical protein
LGMSGTWKLAPDVKAGFDGSNQQAPIYFVYFKERRAFAFRHPIK